MFKNLRAWTEKSIEYLKKNTPKDMYRLVVINNGSRNKIADAIKSKLDEDDVFINYNSSIGISSALNSAIEDHLENSKYFIIMHNDVLVPEMWLERLLEIAELAESNFEEFSAIFPRATYSTEATAIALDEDLVDNFVRNVKMPNQVHASVSDIEDQLTILFGEDGLNKYSEEVYESGPLFSVSQEICNFCTLFSSDVFKRYGGFDDDFIGHGGQYKFFNYKTCCDEIYPIFAKSVFVHHNGNTTTDGLAGSFKDNFQANEKIFEQKKKDLLLEKDKEIKLETAFTLGGASFLFSRNIGIGDIIMSMFAISSMKKMYPKTRVTYMTKPVFAEFVSRFSCVDRVILFPEEERAGGYSYEDAEDLLLDYEDKFDKIINWVEYVESIDSRDIHRVDKFVESLKMEGLKPSFPEYNIDNSEYFSIKRKVPDSDLPRIAVATSGTCKIRSLPEDVYLQIIQKESENKQVIVVHHEKIDIPNYNGNVVNLTGEIELVELFPLFEMCEYIYTPDTGAFHIAGIVNTPCKAFFGSIDPDLRDGQYLSSDRNLIVRKDLPCSPCQDIGCRDIPCMNYSKEELEKIIDTEI